MMMYRILTQMKQASDMLLLDQCLSGTRSEKPKVAVVWTRQLEAQAEKAILEYLQLDVIEQQKEFHFKKWNQLVLVHVEEAPRREASITELQVVRL